MEGIRHFLFGRLDVSDVDALPFLDLVLHLVSKVVCLLMVVEFDDDLDCSGRIIIFELADGEVRFSVLAKKVVDLALVHICVSKDNLNNLSVLGPLSSNDEVVGGHALDVVVPAAERVPLSLLDVPYYLF